MTDEKRETLIDKMMTAKGDEIRAARDRLGMTQAELASKAGTNQQTIDRLERGLTRQSKFMPEIRVALGLPAYDAPEESLVRFSAKYGDLYGVRANMAEDYRNPVEMPVFEMDFNDGADKAAWVIRSEPSFFLPRGYPVENSLGAYGVIVPDDRMAPALRKGEIAIVDPDTSDQSRSEVFMLHGLADGRTAGMLCTWNGFEHRPEPDGELFVKVSFWNPPEAYLARWLTWPAMGSVVAKLPSPKK